MNTQHTQMLLDYFGLSGHFRADDRVLLNDEYRMSRITLTVITEDLPNTGYIFKRLCDLPGTVQQPQKMSIERYDTEKRSVPASTLWSYEITLELVVFDDFWEALEKHV